MLWPRTEKDIQCTNAKKARKLYHIVGAPTMDNCQDVNNPEKIFGLEVSQKSERQGNNPPAKQNQ